MTDITAITKEDDEFMDKLKQLRDEVQAEKHELRKALAAVEKERDELREALKPFADIAFGRESIRDEFEFEIARTEHELVFSAGPNVKRGRLRMSYFRHAEAAIQAIEGEVKDENAMIDSKKIKTFLLECEKYFAKRDTGGEDKAHWANVFNAENCKTAVDYISAVEKERDELLVALKPFADKATAWEKRHPRGKYPYRDSTQLTHRLGDFRYARSVREKYFKETRQ